MSLEHGYKTRNSISDCSIQSSNYSLWQQAEKNWIAGGFAFTISTNGCPE